jgi:hypothetical protein
MREKKERKRKILEFTKNAHRHSPKKIKREIKQN